MINNSNDKGTALNFIYVSHGFSIHPDLQAIKRGEQTVQIRPRTFALLLLLLESPREILSKRYLLDKIWDDVNVDEPVLVQSIRELRQFFGYEVIQTYPRKGYAWSSSVQKLTQEEGKPIPVQRQPRRHKPFALALTSIFLLLLTATFLTKTPTTTSPPYPEIVIVLPVKNTIPGNDHQWVPLGAMDQLIKALVSSRQIQVMEAEYVLELMQYADLPRKYETSQIARIFDLSGATLVVESQLSGTVEEYRLDYKLYMQNDIKRGAFFSSDITDVLHQLSATIATHTGQPLNPIDLQSRSAFNHELMARALESKDSGQLDVARNLLTSLKGLEPHQVVVRKILSDVLIAQEMYEEAAAELEAALEIANPPDSARLLFWLAVTQYEQGLTGQALAILTQATHQAEHNNDLLYQAYAAQLRSDIEQKQGRYDAAEQSLENAISFHTLIRCSIGVFYTRLQLAKLLADNGKLESAETQLAETQKLIERHQLSILTPDMTRLINSIKIK